jgi:hypothetical protein
MSSVPPVRAALAQFAVADGAVRTRTMVPTTVSKRFFRALRYIPTPINSKYNAECSIAMF